MYGVIANDQVVLDLCVTWPQDPIKVGCQASDSGNSKRMVSYIYDPREARLDMHSEIWTHIYTPMFVSGFVSKYIQLDFSQGSSLTLLRINSITRAS